MLVMNNLIKKILIGLFLATLPLAVCWLFAELIVISGGGVSSVGYREEQGRSIAGMILVIGFVMSLIAWFGIGLYALSKFLSDLPRIRHERRLEKLRERGEIDF